MIKASNTHPHAYYLGDLPGTLQYAKDREELLNCLLVEDGNDVGFQMCEHSIENLRRVIPHTQGKKDWKILLMISADFEGEIWLKAALLNKTTGKIALLSSTNKKEHIESRGSRAIKSLDKEWFVGHYRMLAPAMFWRELKNRLLY